MTDDVQQSISADLPLVDPDDDRLGYAPFAERLAGAIAALDPDQAMVLALNGAWGSGKTTVLNFVEHHLRYEQRHGPVVVVRFNPWQFSPDDDLAVRLVDQMQAGLAPANVQLASALEDIGALLSGKRLSTSRRRRAGVPFALDEARAAVADELRKVPRVAVLIDDVDRLEAHQLTELFRAVRAVADFPNVVYLLAFDEGVARSVLSSGSVIDGGQYLEKMVQSAFELPDLDRSLLRDLFFESIDRVLLAEERAGRLDVRYWGNVYWDGLDHFIVTPRHVNRLTNALAITYPGIAGEVNVVDLIAIETLRMFVPHVYETVRAHPYLFTGAAPRVHDSESARRLRAEEAFHQEWLEQVPSTDRDAVKRLVTRVFPRLESVWGTTSFGPESEKLWRRQLRVASPDSFSVYFRFSVPPGRVSRRELEALLRAGGDREAFDELLVEILRADPDRTADRARSLLEQAADLDVADVKPSHAVICLNVLLDRGDDILRFDRTARGSFEFDLAAVLGRALRFFVECVPETERAEVVLEHVRDTKSIAAPDVLFEALVEDVRSSARQTGALSPEDLARIDVACLDLIREGARSGALAAAPLLPRLLGRWSSVSGIDAARSWFARSATDDQALRRLIAGFSHLEIRAEGDDVAGVATTAVDTAALDEYVDVTAVAAWAREQLASGEGTRLERAALKAVSSWSPDE